MQRMGAMRGMRWLVPLLVFLTGHTADVTVAHHEAERVSMRKNSTEIADYWPLDRGNKWIYEHTTGVLNAEGLRIDFQEQVTLEVLDEEERAGQIYVRLNTGQLIRKNEKGDILEYNDRFDEIQDTEMLVFDFSSLTTRDDETFAYRVPYQVMPPTIGGQSLPQGPSVTRFLMYRSFYRVGLDDLFMPLGLANVLVCSFSYPLLDPISEGSVGIVFAPHIGIVRSGIAGNDVGEFEFYLLVEAVIAGEQKFPTNISTSSWGEIKEPLIEKQHPP